MSGEENHLVLRSGNIYIKKNLRKMAEVIIPIPPPKFDGTEKNDVDEWIANYVQVCNANGWNDAKKVELLACYLEGHAAQWYQSRRMAVGAPVTWVQWDGALTTEFRSSNIHKLRTLEQNKMRLGESPEEYYYRTTKLCRQCNVEMVAEIIVHH